MSTISVNQVSQPVIDYYQNGLKRTEKWCQNGTSHRENGPAFICYYENGNICSEEWYQNNKCHREDGPAKIDYYENGHKDCEIWFQYNLKHRLDGPAGISYNYNENDNIEDIKYYVNGIELTENNFYKFIYLIKKFIKNKQKTSLYTSLKQSQLNLIGKYIYNLICKFTY